MLSSNPLERAYIHGVDWKALREALRLERERAQMTLDELAKTAKLNRATIHSIENVKREPDLKPELESVEKIVGAMGMTLSEFFLQIECQPNADLPVGGNQRRKKDSPEAGSDGSHRAVSPTTEKRLADFLRDLAHQLNSAADQFDTARLSQSPLAQAGRPARSPNTRRYHR